MHYSVTALTHGAANPLCVCVCVQDHGTAKTNMFETTADKFASSLDVVEEQLKHETVGECHALCPLIIGAWGCNGTVWPWGVTSDLSVDL